MVEGGEIKKGWRDLSSIYKMRSGFSLFCFHSNTYHRRSTFTNFFS